MVHKELTAGSRELVATLGAVVVLPGALWFCERASAGLLRSFPVGRNGLCDMTSFRNFDGSSSIVRIRKRGFCHQQS